MDARKFLADKYNLDLNKPSPIEIPNVGRNTLCDWFRELDFKRGAEVGVEFGKFSEVIMRANPSLELFCVDSWQNYEGYLDPINQKPDLPNGAEIVRQKLNKYPNVHCVQGFSHKVAKQFKDNSLDFVYIDANHNLPWVMDDIIDWEKKVRPGGIIAGHDYVYHKNFAHYVIEAVRWYTELKPIPLWFLLGTKAKVEGQIRDHSRSWMWIK